MEEIVRTEFENGMILGIFLGIGLLGIAMLIAALLQNKYGIVDLFVEWLDGVTAEMIENDSIFKPLDEVDPEYLAPYMDKILAAYDAGWTDVFFWSAGVLSGYPHGREDWTPVLVPEDFERASDA